MTSAHDASPAGVGTGRETSPLAPLTPGEMEEAVRRALDACAGARVVAVSLREPDKQAYLRWRDEAGKRPARRARVVLADGDGVVESTVELGGTQVPTERRVEGAQPPFTSANHAAATDLVLADPAFQAALRRRGIEDLGLVHLDVLPAGAFGDPLEAGHRLARAVAYLRTDATANPYARPIEHLMALVDLDALAVLEVEDGPDRPIPDADGEYRAGALPAREDLRPIEITQPQGASFTIDGNEIRWQRWTMLAAVDYQEGLVLHDVRYDGRPVLHRGSCAEMVVPYADPDPMHRWRNYFDAGEIGLGRCANSLENGCDCLGEIEYIDAHVYRDTEVRTIRNAICVHEEDSGLLWKHTDKAVDAVEVRRGRRLVVNFMATVGNYEYAFRWNFHLDGRIQMEVQLHGIVSTTAVPDGEDRPGANLVDRGLAGSHHQHLFGFRLDLDVDGPANTVIELGAESLPRGEGNPYGNAFRQTATVLAHEGQAQRDVDVAGGRSWLVESAEACNGLGRPTAYRLVPGEGTARLLADPDSSIGRRAAFARHNLWVTPHDPEERHPAGAYPYQRSGSDGLAAWSRDRPLVGRDVVLWYTTGVTHFVRPEDWPIMPVATIGFTLEPVGFFDRNPTLDLPAPEHACHRADG